MTAKVAAEKVVTIHYTLKNDAGEILDSSDGRDPLDYLHGADNIVAGLEKALDGQEAGAEVKAVVPPAEGYGEHDPKLVENIPMRKLGKPWAQPGERFRVQTDQGPRVLTVVGTKGDYAMVDANHPLAGVTLHFEVKIVEIRDASKEELEHGHPHGPGGHHH
jgi:FKBP-type peptidyl-prolyl cis-trans isomerase SlyD